MPKYTVQMTLAAPALPGRVTITRRLPGRGASIRLIWSDGMIAVTAVHVSATLPAEAVQIVFGAVHDTIQEHWRQVRGSLQQRSWRVHQERVLIGARRGVVTEWSWPPRDDGDSGGTAGVREPRRPRPGPGSARVAKSIRPAREITWYWPGNDDGGTAGVREPRQGPAKR